MVFLFVVVLFCFAIELGVFLECLLFCCCMLLLLLLFVFISLLLCDCFVGVKLGFLVRIGLFEYLVFFIFELYFCCCCFVLLLFMRVDVFCVCVFYLFV